MNISSTAFYKNKEKKMKLLEDFAIFHFEGKKIVIDEVLEEEYIKKNEKFYREIKKLIPKIWDKSGLDSCSRVGRKIYNLKREEIGFNISLETTKKYVTKAKYELFNKQEKEIIKEIRMKYFGDANEVQDIVNDMILTNEINENEGLKVLNRLINWTKDKFLETGEIVTFTLDLSGNA